MNTVDRTKPPEFKEIENIDIIKAKSRKLSNNIPVYMINAGNQDLVKVEFVFKAGRRFQNKPLVAAFTNRMIREGTTTRNSHQISEKLDYYGAQLQLSADKDFASVSLLTVNEFFKDSLKIVEDILKNAVFPDEEFQVLQATRKQEYLINQEKVSYQANKKFFEIVMGSDHPYGRMASAGDFDNLRSQWLREFYKKHYTSENCNIIIGGKIKPEHLTLLDKRFGENDWKKDADNFREVNAELQMVAPEQHYIEKQDAVQSSLRIGKVLFNKLHPDYRNLQILTTLLGGYFGSRLMTNLRENKGYTYGVHSSLVPLVYDGYFIVASQVSAEFSRKAADEVYNEIKKLRTESIPQEELDLVKNYFRGDLLRMFDGVFSLMDSFMGILEYGLDYDYYEEYFRLLQNFNSETANELTEKYLHEDTLTEIIAGPPA